MNDSPAAILVDSSGNELNASGSVKIAGPVTVSNTVAITGSVGVIGTVTANLGTTSNLLLDGTFTTRIPVPGQTTSALSVPVVLATDYTGSVNIANQIFVTSTGSLPVTVGNFPATQPISAISLPLPSGAATETTLGTRLAEATFTTRIPVPGQTTSALSVPVVLATNYTGSVNVLNQISVTSTGSLAVAVQNFPATQTITGSVGITNVVPISATSLPLPSGAATETTLGTRLAEATFTTRIPTVGQKAGSASVPVVLATDYTGSVNVVNQVTVTTTGSLPVLARIFDSNNNGIRSTISNELRVAGVYTLADLHFKYGINYDIFDTKTVTGGAVTAVVTGSMVTVGTTTSSGSFAAIRTNKYFKYIGGHIQSMQMSVINSDSGLTGQVREWGYLDENNGVFFQLSGSTFSVCERSNISNSVVTTQYQQSTWNKDKLDGAGPSGITFDVTKAHLYEIECQWFGIGVVRYFIDMILVHEVNHTNSVVDPYMQSACLPIQVSVNNFTAVSSAQSVKFICSAVHSQARVQDFHHVARSIYTNRQVSTSFTPLIVIRPQATLAGVTNRTVAIPTKVELSTSLMSIFEYEVRLNPTITGGSYSIDSDSSIEYNTTATSCAGGIVLSDGVFSSTVAVELGQLFDYYDRCIQNAGFLGTGTNSAVVLCISCKNVRAGRADFDAAIYWDEIR